MSLAPCILFTLKCQREENLLALLMFSFARQLAVMRVKCIQNQWILYYGDTQQAHSCTLRHTAALFKPATNAHKISSPVMFN